MERRKGSPHQFLLRSIFIFSSLRKIRIKIALNKEFFISFYLKNYDVMGRDAVLSWQNKAIKYHFMCFYIFSKKGECEKIDTMNKYIETHTIHIIPEDQRHGRLSDLFTVWFSANMTLLTVFTGALGPVVFHLSLLWSALAVILGNMVGAVFMALHAAQGPRLGVPQMVQSRGQFGVYGSLPVILLVVLMYIGFAASNCAVGGQALEAVFPLSHASSIILVAILTLLPCALGYKAIHFCSKLASWVSAFVVLWAIIVGLGMFSPDLLMDMRGTFSGFLGAFSISVLWQIAYAPYVSDSSRYLPMTSSSVRWSFWASYGGTVIGAVLPMILGSLLSLRWSGSTVNDALLHSMGRGGAFFLSVLALAIPLANAMSVYCGALCSLTFVHTFFPHLKMRMGSRLVAVALLLFCALFMSLGMAGNFLASYTAFLDILMAVLVPWTAINLTDYYILKKGDYDVQSFFRRDGGIYGLWNHRAIITYVIGVLTELPFLKTSLFTGFLVKYIGNIDISWGVGLAVSAFLYGIWGRYHKKGVERR